MQERTGDLFEDKSLSLKVLRYESMRQGGTPMYFDVEDYVNIVNFYIDKSKLKSANEACRIALSIHPTATELKLKHAQILVGIGEPQAAINKLRQVNELKGSSYEYFATKGIARILLGDLDKAVKDYDLAIQLCEFEEKEDLFYNIGESLENSGNFIMALKYYSKANKAFPGNYDFIFRMAFCFDKNGLFDLSIKYYNRFLDYNPFSENAWYNIGIIYNKVEDFKNAVEAYSYAIALDNEHYDAVFNMANAMANNEAYLDAIKAYKEYLEVYPGSFTAQYYIGECYYQLQSYVDAKLHFERIIQEFPEFADSYYGLGLVFTEIEKRNEAIEAFNMALSIDKEHSDAWFALGNVHASNKDWNKSIASYEKALTVNKFDVDAILACANIYSDNLQNEKAIKLLDESLEYIGNSAELMYAFAGILFKTGSKKLGLSWFKKAYELSPDDFDITFRIDPESKNYNEISELVNKII